MLLPAVRGLATDASEEQVDNAKGWCIMFVVLAVVGAIWWMVVSGWFG